MTNRSKGYLMIVAAGIFCSTTEVVLKVLSAALAPMQITVVRVLIAALFMLPFALHDLKKKNAHLQKEDWQYFILLGFLSVALHLSLLQLSVVHMDASASATIYSGSPVFTLLAAHLILHEPLKKSHVVAISLELVGILFILNPLCLELNLRGFCEALGATVAAALYGTLCKPKIPRLGSITITTFCMLFGGFELLLLLMLGKTDFGARTFEAFGLGLFSQIPLTTGYSLWSAILLCYGGIVCAGLGLLFVAKVTEYTSATESSFIYLIKPILATLLAVAVFHEKISIHRAIGILFFVAASLCVSVPVLHEMYRKDRLPKEK